MSSDLESDFQVFASLCLWKTHKVHMAAAAAGHSLAAEELHVRASPRAKSVSSTKKAARWTGTTGRLCAASKFQWKALTFTTKKQF